MRLRHRFVRYFKGEPGVRPPFMYVFGPMRQTVERWLQEGMEDEEQWFHDVGFEGRPGKQFGNRPSVNAFVCPPFQQKVLDDDGRFRTLRNAWGAVVKVPCDKSRMAYPLEFPVRDIRTWLSIKERLAVDSGQRFPLNWEEEKAECDAAGIPCSVGGLPCGFFGAPRELFGAERFLLCLHDEPSLVEEVLDTLCALWCELFSRIAGEMRVDFLFIWEDMCFRGGPLISPAMFRRFMLPRYKRLTSTLREAGIPLMLVDTDGDCTQLLDLFVEGGIDIVIPLEVQAGMDARKVRSDFPELGLVGAVEKSTPAGSEEAKQAELEKVKALLQSGRYLPCSDHGVPPTVSYPQYVDFYRRIRELVLHLEA